MSRKRWFWNISGYTQFGEEYAKRSVLWRPPHLINKEERHEALIDLANALKLEPNIREMLRHCYQFHKFYLQKMSSLVERHMKLGVPLKYSSMLHILPQWMQKVDKKLMLLPAVIKKLISEYPAYSPPKKTSSASSTGSHAPLPCKVRVVPAREQQIAANRKTNILADNAPSSLAAEENENTSSENDNVHLDPGKRPEEDEEVNCEPKVDEVVKVPEPVTGKVLTTSKFINAVVTRCHKLQVASGRKILYHIAKKMKVETYVITNIWQRITSIAMWKLRALLAAGDDTSKVSPDAQMTPDDWLVADVVLLYGNPGRLITNTTLGTKELLRPLVTLFHMAQTYRIEEDTSQTIMSIRWQRITVRYNNKNISASRVLLQRRWFELKQVAGRRLRARLRAPEPAVPPHPLFTVIARRFPRVVTKPQPDWSRMINDGLVHFDQKVNLRHTIVPTNIQSSAETDDVILIEKQVETIDVLSDSENDERLVIDEAIAIKQERGDTVIGQSNSAKDKYLNRENIDLLQRSLELNNLLAVPSLDCITTGNVLEQSNSAQSILVNDTRKDNSLITCEKFTKENPNKIDSDSNPIAETVESMNCDVTDDNCTTCANQSDRDSESTGLEISEVESNKNCVSSSECDSNTTNVDNANTNVQGLNTNCIDIQRNTESIDLLEENTKNPTPDINQVILQSEDMGVQAQTIEREETNVYIDKTIDSQPNSNTDKEQSSCKLMNDSKLKLDLLEHTTCKDSNSIIKNNERKNHTESATNELALNTQSVTDINMTDLKKNSSTELNIDAHPNDNNKTNSKISSNVNFNEHLISTEVDSNKSQESSNENVSCLKTSLSTVNRSESIEDNSEDNKESQEAKNKIGTTVNKIHIMTPSAINSKYSTCTETPKVYNNTKKQPKNILLRELLEKPQSIVVIRQTDKQINDISHKDLVPQRNASEIDNNEIDLDALQLLDSLDPNKAETTLIFDWDSDNEFSGNEDAVDNSSELDLIRHFNAEDNVLLKSHLETSSGLSEDVSNDKNVRECNESRNCTEDFQIDSKILMSTQINLRRIDETESWKKYSKNNTIDLSLVDEEDFCGPNAKNCKSSEGNVRHIGPVEEMLKLCRPVWVVVSRLRPPTAPPRRVKLPDLAALRRRPPPTAHVAPLPHRPHEPYALHYVPLRSDDSDSDSDVDRRYSKKKPERMPTENQLSTLLKELMRQGVAESAASWRRRHSNSSNTKLSRKDRHHSTSKLQLDCACKDCETTKNERFLKEEKDVQRELEEILTTVPDTALHVRRKTKTAKYEDDPEFHVKTKRSRKKKQKPEVARKTPKSDDGYQEWIMQRNIHRKYFTLPAVEAQKSTKKKTIKNKRIQTEGHSADSPTETSNSQSEKPANSDSANINRLPSILIRQMPDDHKILLQQLMNNKLKRGVTKNKIIFDEDFRQKMINSLARLEDDDKVDDRTIIPNNSTGIPTNATGIPTNATGIPTNAIVIPENANEIPIEFDSTSLNTDGDLPETMHNDCYDTVNVADTSDSEDPCMKLVISNVTSLADCKNEDEEKHRLENSYIKSDVKRRYSVDKTENAIPETKRMRRLSTSDEINDRCKVIQNKIKVCRQRMQCLEVDSGAIGQVRVSEKIEMSINGQINQESKASSLDQNNLLANVPSIVIKKYIQDNIHLINSLAVLCIDQNVPLWTHIGDHLIITDHKIPIESPSYWSMGPIDQIARLILDDNDTGTELLRPNDHKASEDQAEQSGIQTGLSGMKTDQSGTKTCESGTQTEQIVKQASQSEDRSDVSSLSCQNGGTLSKCGSFYIKSDGTAVLLNAPNDICIDNKIYKKLYSNPLVYARVMFVVSSKEVFEKFKEMGTTIQLYSLRTGKLSPIISKPSKNTAYVISSPASTLSSSYKSNSTPDPVSKPPAHNSQLTKLLQNTDSKTVLSPAKHMPNFHSILPICSKLQTAPTSFVRTPLVTVASTIPLRSSVITKTIISTPRTNLSTALPTPVITPCISPTFVPNVFVVRPSVSANKSGPSGCPDFIPVHPSPVSVRPGDHKCPTNKLKCVSFKLLSTPLNVGQSKTNNSTTQKSIPHSFIKIQPKLSSTDTVSTPRKSSRKSKNVGTTSSGVTLNRLLPSVPSIYKK